MDDNTFSFHANGKNMYTRVQNILTYRKHAAQKCLNDFNSCYMC